MIIDRLHIQQLSGQLDKAFYAWHNEPSSAEKRQAYERKKKDLDSLYADMKKRLFE